MTALDVIVIGQEVQPEITAAARRRLQCVIAGMIRADQVHRPPLRVALFQGFQQDQMIQAPGRNDTFSNATRRCGRSPVPNRPSPPNGGLAST